ncbi:transcription antitermination factor NusB [Arcanobacterium haemolyticum]|uniref:transcription antitermination factor NusB n=1 Tax=Arcanobacterium haemolyticum TaxID=28264 RepID=UPI000D9D1D8F|nr:transcription antitermination factor NusB [Arcanobacterium haemolyticum]SPT74446.1 N utilization substance protein B homolog [Arcanobacterium haemolyticum]
MSNEERTQQRRNNGRKGRSLQRQRALDVLYEADVRGAEHDLASLLEERSQLSPSQQPIQKYGQLIVTTYAEWADDVDSMIEAASPQWALARMSVVDRNLLRIGATELMYLDVPTAIVVKEITALVRDFSTDKAVGFTMGVLNRIAEIRSEETSGRDASE